MEDVMPRKLTEQALRDSEEKYRTVLKSSPDPIVVYDQGGRAIYVNPAFGRTFGWSKEELIGKLVVAGNGKEAVEIYEREGNRISLIVLDLIMPEMDGNQCLAGILRVNPEARVLIASGHSVNGQAEELLETGAKGFLGKPYDMRQFLTTVREVIDKG